MKSNIEIAVEAAKMAGNWLKENYNKEIQVNSSVGKDIKLQADLESERIVFEILKENSEYSILSEEFGFLDRSESNSLRWIIDPLDGSLNYMKGLDISCVSIGLWDGDSPVLGVIYDFLRNNMYTGVVGEHAFLNGNKIVTSETNEVAKSVLCTGFPVYMDMKTKTLESFILDIQNFKKLRLFGSAALSLAMVSKGAAEVYREDNIAIWDVAAGIPIVLAAGGKCIFETGNGENYLNVIATNGNLEL